MEKQLPQEKKTPAPRPSPESAPALGYWVIAILLITGSIAGLFTLGWMTWYLEKDIRHAALLAVALCLGLGAGAVLISILAEGAKGVVRHFIHELGMAFLVGAIVLTVVEITIQIQHERHITKVNGEHQEMVDKLNREHNAKIETLTTKHTKNIEDLHLTNSKSQKDYFENRARQDEVRVHLVQLLDGLAPRKNRRKSELKSDLAALAALESSVKHEQLDLWKTRFLDNYGVVLISEREFALAKEQFKEALVIDQKLADKDDNIDNLSSVYHSNLAVTYTRLAETEFILGEIHAAIASQKNAADKLNAIKSRLLIIKNASENNRDEAIKQKILADYKGAADAHKFGLALVQKYEKFSSEWSDAKYTKIVAPLQVGLNQKGELTNGERWKTYKCNLQKGQTYRIDLKASTPRLDPYLAVRHANPHMLLILNDDIDPDNPDETKRDFNSSITFVCPNEGDYFVIATASSVPAPGREDKTGEFQLGVFAIDTKK